MNLSLIKKVRILSGLIIVIIALNFIFSQKNNYRVQSDIASVTNIGIPLEQDILEMEINLGDSSRAVLGYLRTQDQNFVARFNKEEENFERNYELLLEKSKGLHSDRVSLLVETVFTKYLEFKTIGDDLIKLEDNQISNIAILKADVTEIDNILNNDLKPILSKINSKELIMALEMEIRIDKLFTNAELYLIEHDAKLKKEVTRTESEFSFWYNKLSVSINSSKHPEDISLFVDKINSNFLDAVKLVDKMILLEDKKIALLTILKHDQEEIDGIIDNKLQPFILKNLQDLNLDASHSSELNSLLTYLTTAFLLFFIVLFIFTVQKSILDRLLEIRDVMDVTLLGDYTKRSNDKGNDEIGDLSKTLNTLLDTLNYVTLQADKISQGDYRGKVIPKSEADTLGLSLQKMIKSLRKVSLAADKVSKGDTSVLLIEQSEEDILAKSFNKMTKTLNDASRENTKAFTLARWRESYSIATQGNLSLTDYSSILLEFLAEKMNAVIGVFYVPNGEKLSSIASIGISDKEHQLCELSLGEGLLGQAAKERKTKIFTNLPVDYLTIISATGKHNPSSVVIVPLVLNNDLLGIFELGALEIYSEVDLDCLLQLVDMIAVHTNAAKNREYTNNLLLETQQKSQLLKSQDHALNVHALVSITDVNGKITYVNEKFCEISKYTEEELLGKDHRILNSSFHPKSFIKNLWDTIIQGNVWQDEICNRGKYGDTFWVDSTIVGYKDLSGEITQFVAISNDVTEKKLADENIRRAIDEANKANKSKSEFLANMSHELRTPMNAVLGYTQLLKKTFKKKEELSEYIVDLDEIEYSGKHLLSLINDVLDISKIEAGKMETNIEEFEVVSELESIANIVQPLATKGHNKFEYFIDSELDHMNSDVTKLKQIILNFLSNAFKFTKDGKIILNAKKVNFQEGQALFVEVIDTGIGMSKDHLDKIFDSFTQADSSMTRKYGGTGLGLSISKKFVEMLGGVIEAKSVEGVGSTFSMTVPLNLESAILNWEERQPERTKVPFTKILGNELTILIIDDQERMHDITRKSFQDFEYRFLSAYDGETGIAMAREQHPDIILLDIEFPGISGWDILNILKNDEQLADIPVIMATVSGDKNTAFSLGASGFLQKPIEHEVLAKVLAKYGCETPPCLALVVEDEKINQDLMCRILKKEGWAVDVADNGLVALEMMKKKTPEIIFLDLMMPEMDGFSFLDEIKKHAEWANIPIIVVTAKELSKEEKHKLDHGVRTYLQKGEYSIDELEEELIRVANFCRINKNAA
ncbi:hypothetical protein A9Q84_11335 [Halobacteriovorax marinus]|uniref:histidine kinase n=1 Tax=Halobacteriovorax marinus TaxID=97084 RepID=A0A1Y5FBU2_9BACT|nr:hypothetical protein A9Q84_11335 [Halobacteriovorax marinus]